MREELNLELKIIVDLHFGMLRMYKTVPNTMLFTKPVAAATFQS